MFLYIRQNLIIASKKWVWRRTFGLKVRLDQIKAGRCSACHHSGRSQGQDDEMTLSEQKRSVSTQGNNHEMKNIHERTLVF